MLRDYHLELRRENVDTTIKIEVERDSNTDLNKRVFKRIYICLGPLKKGFKVYGRDLLGLDGAFMKGPYPGQLLTVVGLDGNNGIYLLAYAIMEEETTCSWTWFLECLSDDLGMTKESNLTFINDRQKLLLWLICDAATIVPYFDRAMEELKEFNKEAFEGLAKIPAHSRAKSDILLNNLCECKILDARDAPIIIALEYIKEYLMRRMVNDIAVINKTDGPLTPSVTKLLKVAMDKASKYTVRKWELTGIPCAHAIATNYNMALNGIQVGIPEEWVHKCYWLATWKHAYSYTLRCLNGKVMWKKSQIPTTLTPLKHHNLVGRPRKYRRKTKEEKAQMVKDGKLTNTAAGTRKRPYDAYTTPSTAVGSRKNPSDAGTTLSTAPIKKKHATRSSNAGTTPSTAPTTGSGQNRMTKASFAAAKKQMKNRKTLI
ncbi:mutator type transposase [Tanacetum coccineum]